MRDRETAILWVSSVLIVGFLVVSNILTGVKEVVVVTIRESTFVDRLTKRISQQFVGLALLALGIALAQWDEYGAALACFAGGSFVLFLRAYHWVGFDDFPRFSKRLLKPAFVCITAAMIVGSYPVTLARKGNKPWSATLENYVGSHWPTLTINITFPLSTPPSFWSRKTNIPVVALIRTEAMLLPGEIHPFVHGYEIGKPLSLNVYLDNPTNVVAENSGAVGRIFLPITKELAANPTAMQNRYFKEFMKGFKKVYKSSHSYRETGPIGPKDKLTHYFSPVGPELTVLMDGQLTDGSVTMLMVGVILFSDKYGQHEREFCEYLQHPWTSFVIHGCDGHNGLVY